MQEVKNIHILHLDLALKIMVMYIDSDLTEAKRELRSQQCTVLVGILYCSAAYLLSELHV